MRRRVVITGMGVITPLGHTVADLFASQVAGRTAVGPLTRFDAGTMPTTFASEVKGFKLSRYLEDAARYAHCGVNTQFARFAGRSSVPVRRGRSQTCNRSADQSHAASSFNTAAPRCNFCCHRSR